MLAGYDLPTALSPSFTVRGAITSMGVSYRRLHDDSKYIFKWFVSRTVFEKKYTNMWHANTAQIGA